MKATENVKYRQEGSCRYIELFKSVLLTSFYSYTIIIIIKNEFCRSSNEKLR